MKEFDYEVFQKKRIAQSAKYRKNGSKSKKCSMSTDHMTDKEWKERNGKVVSYYMNKPMDWKEFKSLPFDAQRNYLNGIIEKYGVNSTNLSEMFGVSGQAIRRYLNNNDMGIKFQVGHSLTAKQRALWREFIDQEEENRDEADTSGEPEEGNIASADGNDICEEPIEEKSCNGMNMDTFTIRFVGKLDLKSIYHSLIMMLGNDGNGELSIIYNKGVSV